MTTQDNQHLSLATLGQRWHQDADQILELAIAGKVALWCAFTEVFVQQAVKTGGGKKKKNPVVVFHSLVELKLAAEELVQLQGRCDRMMIAAQLSCLDADNKPVTVTNSVGEEWGDSSMLGLNPGELFARLDEVLRYERKHKLTPPLVLGAPAGSGSPNGEVSPLNPVDHPGHAPELHAAVACWQALCARKQATDPALKKATILAWLGEHHPELADAARARIALVVLPQKKGG